ncbi:DUF2207 domain-containing protein [Myxosarcina sp. GI1]|uniref:DUF2207 domain-containing protein n=1 Tax=Myxosarcina sp. GI1 TaxID=1541065 RepID=UPI00069006AC|nr:DUF2207 domain-containing protein [Myxosarcina sp. GI1]
MNCEQQQLFAKIKAFSFDKPDTKYTFVRRLAHENNWNFEYARRAIEEYRKFAFLAVVAEHIVTPSEQVDRVWHLHLTYTHSYWNEFCTQLLDKPLHHQPSQGGSSETTKYKNLYCQTLDSYIKFFGDTPPIDIWSSPDIRFGSDLASKWINTEKNWIIPKPDFSFLLDRIAKKRSIKFKTITTVIISLFLAVLITLGWALPSSAQAPSFYWDFINVILDVRDNGDLIVTEEQKYVFTESNSHQRYRFIKLDEIEDIRDVEVFEDNHRLPITTYFQNDKFWIRWEDYLADTNTHIFTLKYRAVGATSNSYGADTLNWKAIFPKRKAPINNSKITINLPESLVGKVRDYYSIGGNFKSELIDDATIQFTSLQSLPPEQSVVTKVTFWGNYLHFQRHNSSVVGDREIALTFENIFGYIIVGLMCLGFLAYVAIALFMFFCATTSNLSKNSSRRNGGCTTGGGCGGCGGGG